MKNIYERKFFLNLPEDEIQTMIGYLQNKYNAKKINVTKQGNWTQVTILYK